MYETCPSSFHFGLLTLEQWSEAGQLVRGRE